MTAAVLLLLACGGAFAASQPPQGTTVDPESLYKSWGCSICHGVDRAGGKNAPSLAALETSWNVDKLSDYILDPARWRASDPRIRKLAEQYPKLTMPPSKKPEAERRALATWLLSGHR